MKLKGIEIKPGMVIITANSGKYVVAPVEIIGVRFAFFNIDGGWTTKIVEEFIVEIKSPPRSMVVDSGITLWKTSYELSMKEIAERFGIPVEYLRIKKE